MFTEQPSYSTTILRGPPGQDQFFHVNIENEWDYIAEAVVGSNVQQSTQLNQLALLLSSHGIVVHRPPTVPTYQTESSIIAPDDAHSRAPFITTTLGDNSQVTSTPDISESFLPRDVALVHGTRVIEAPSPLHAGSSEGEHSNFVQNASIFRRLESAGAEVIRWPSYSNFVGGSNKSPEEKLVDLESSQQDSDKEEEGPLFCPSDILILSPTLLLARLSAFTNNKGLEYLWSVLSGPLREEPFVRDNERDVGGLRQPLRTLDGSRSAHTTTLIVRIKDADSSTTSSASATSSPRLPMFGADVSKNAPTGYTPLSRVLVPVKKKIMLYDPALVAEDEARRLKSILDRVQEDSRGVDENGATYSGGIFTGRHLKRDSEMSYGTFGSLDRTDGEGWQFIGIDGLHSTSMLMVSPQLALLSLAPSTMDLSAAKYTRHRILTNVSQVLESLGVRPVKLPSADLNYWHPIGGVRDAVLVLRRESNLEISENGNDQNNGEAQHQDEGENGEGCMAAICAALSVWFCESLPNNEESEADTSERL